MKIDRNIEDMVLLEDLQSGNQKSFEKLFRKYYPMLCAYVHRFVDLEDAENIVQEIMLWMWEQRQAIIIESSLSQYLFKMAYNRAINLMTKREATERAEMMFHSKYQQQWTEDINYYQIAELTNRIEEAIAALPESYQTAFVMHRFKNMNYKSIAEVLNVSSKTVDYRIQQALKLLREQLKDYLTMGLTLITWLT